MPLSTGRKIVLGLLGGRVAVRYLLYDAFTTDRAAGAVNGTLSESPFPTGGGVVRTVVDTNGKLSIAGGVASFATGGVGNGNPWLGYPLQTRVAGKLFLYAAKMTTNGLYGGLYSAQSGTPLDGFRFIDPTLLQALEAGGPISVGAIAAGINYTILLVQRSVGGFYLFIKSGVLPYSMIWISSTGTANLYPGVCAYGGTSVFTADNIRIPVATWLPTPLAYDTFTRADGAPGSTETTGPDGQATLALAWTNQVGTAEIVSGKIVTTALSGGIAIATVTPSTADVLADMALVRGTGTPGLVFRYQDSSNYGYAVHNGTNAQLHKVVAGVDTTLVNAAATYSAGAVVRVICYGTKWRLYYNNAFIGTEQTVSDAALQSGTGVGWYSTDTDSTGDLFLVHARGTGGEHNALDAY